MQRGCGVDAAPRFRYIHSVGIDCCAMLRYIHSLSIAVLDLGISIQKVFTGHLLCALRTQRETMNKDPRPGGLLSYHLSRVERHDSCLPQGLESDYGLWSNWILSHLFHSMRKSFSSHLLNLSLLSLPPAGLWDLEFTLPVEKSRSCLLMRAAEQSLPRPAAYS